VHADDGYFDERVAARYDESSADMFDPAVVDPVVDFLVELAAWPSELDLMAQLARMRLRERWSGWKREPFASDSRKHVSVWEKPAGEGRRRTSSRSRMSDDFRLQSESHLLELKGADA